MKGQRVTISLAERRITLDRIEAAAAAIDPVFLHTPQWVCEPLADDLGVRVGPGETSATLRVGSPQQIGELLGVIATERAAGRE